MFGYQTNYIRPSYVKGDFDTSNNIDVSGRVVYPPFPIHFRFTHHDENDLARLNHFLESFKTPRIISVLEEADIEVPRDHTHTCIYVPELKQEFSKRVRKFFPIHKGNSSFAVYDHLCVIRSKNKGEVSGIDPLDLERYVCKGKARGVEPNVLLTTLTYEEVMKRHHEYWDVYEQYIINLAKQRSLKKLSWTEQCLEELKEKFIGIVEIDEESINKITEVVLVRLGKTAKKFSLRTISEMVLGLANALLMNKNPKSYEKWSKHVSSRVYNETRLLGDD